MVLALASAAHAQTPEAPPSPPPPSAAEAEARIVYDAAFYSQFSPRTALDMVNRTPGFALIEGAERRGFAGAVGNVLIDGERPSAKSQTLSDILQRIPAAQVVRIEILRGGQTAGDASGQAVLANVVRTRAEGQGAWSLGAEYAAQHQAAPNGWASWSGRVGTIDYSLGANGYSLLRENPGEREIRSADGVLTETRQDDSPRHFYETAINGEAARAAFGGRLRLTGQAYYSRYHQDETILTLSPEGIPLGDEFNPYTESKRQFEGGVHYERSLGAWDATFVGLLTRTRFESEITSTRHNLAGAVESVFMQAIERDSGESILRGSLEREFSPTHRFEAGLEGAFNTLDARLALTFDFGGGPFPVPVPNSNLAVEESRADAFLAYAWRPNARWSLDARLAGEASRLSFTGDKEGSTELFFFKPSLQIARNFGTRNQMRLRLYRDVSQLDFDDFVSSASLSDEIIEGGNPDLRPETSWRIEAAADLRFGGDGALGVTLFRHWLSDAIDLAAFGPPEARFDAPANIGEGDVEGVTLTLRAPLAPIVPGGSATFEATLQESSVTDPLTGQSRTMSEFEETQLKAEFRQDLPARKLAWGAAYQGEAQTLRFRFNEIETWREHPSLEVFIETTALAPLKLRLTAINILQEQEQRERIFFVGDRTGPIDRIERGERSPGSLLLFALSGNF